MKAIDMLRLLITVLIGLLPVVARAQTGAPVKSEEPTPWIPAEDLRAMEGRWRMDTDFGNVPEKYLPKDRHGNRVITSLFKLGAVLKIRDGKYSVEESQDDGKVFNEYVSGIKFRPDGNRWLNTQEPLLSLSARFGSQALFSYVLDGDKIYLRHPRNSCSRSGIRITLSRISDGQPDGEETDQGTR